MTEGSGNCTSIINLTYQAGSEGSPSNPAKFSNQDYTQLKNTYLRKRKLFVDSTFPPNNRSLGDLPDISSWREAQVEWLRPAHWKKGVCLCHSPGNCWFLAAVSSLTFHKNLMVQVVPMEQSFNRNAGIFHFRFWRFGKWVDVVIDDYLPTLDNSLLSVRSKSGNEFWVPLLEKAYAKVCGSYADMNAGLPSEAFLDFSGGVSMIYRLREEHGVGHDEQLWLSLKRATGCDSMICCGTAPKGLVNTVAHTGLVDAHAYSVTGVTEVSYYGSKVKLVRVMNPWGKQEWNGKWSDGSKVWNSVSAADREKCRKSDNGEFWIELGDFCYYFVSLFICCENPNFIDGDLSCQWKCQIYEGSWVAGTSAGGNVNECEQNFLLCQPIAVFVASFSLYVSRHEKSAPKGRLGRSFFRTNPTVKDGQKYFYDRNVTEFHSLEPGDYVVIPSTMKPYMNSEFILTVFSKAETKIK
uniref:Calpain catalytic domain-containing protein n=1 Tax=Mola mola TaxID=94237 RepID=A0A3Q3WBK0_MOLML